MFKSVLLSLALCVSATAFAKGTVISAFQPQGLVEPTNQIRVVFSDKMVSLSTTPNADIFNMTCSPGLTGTAVWANETTWQFDFQTAVDGNKIPGGTRCQLTLKTGVKDLAGKAVAANKTYKFQVDGPNILSIYPGYVGGTNRSTVTEDQVFAISLDSEVDPASVVKSVYFKVDGVASNVGVKVLTDAEKAEVLKTDTFKDQYFDANLPVIFIKAKQPFPDNRKITLVWGKGVKSPVSGISRQADLAVQYESRPLFSANITCTREHANTGCSPFSDMELTFNADFPAAQAKQIRLVGADGTIIPAQLSVDDKGSASVSKVIFPATVKENQSYRIEVPKTLKDENGRTLSSVPKTEKTSGFPPLAKFAADFGIIEANVTPVMLPATLRNLEANVIGQTIAPAAVQGSSVRLDANSFPDVVKWMKTLERKGTSKPGGWSDDRDKSVFSKSSVKPTAFNIPLKAKGKYFEVVGIPLKGPGFYVVELQSKLLGQSLLGKDVNMFVPTGALVTNMVVHAKWGKENSLFWVTTLDNAQPVSGATVEIYDCNGKVVGQPLTTDKDGIARVNSDLQTQMNVNECSNGNVGVLAKGKNGKKAKVQAVEDQSPTRYDQGFFVSAQQGNDFTFTHTSWTDGIEYWRFGSINETNPSYADDGTVATTVMDRTLFKVGEKVSMKHFIRQAVLSGLSLKPKAALPTSIQIDNYENNIHFTAALKWDANGVAVSTYEIPKESKVGTYYVSLTKGSPDNPTVYSTGSFQVSDFKIPLMKGLISFPNRLTQLVQPGKLDTKIAVSYQGGGPAPNKAVTFRYTVNRGWGNSFESFPGMTFGGERLVEKHGRTQDNSETNEKTVQVPVRLDANGTTVVQIPDLSGFDSIKSITTQLEFVDANSEVQDVTRTFDVYPAAVLVGVAADNNYPTDKTLSFKVGVVDLKGKPVVGVNPTLQLLEQITYTHKTRMVGGFYSSESFTDTSIVPATFTCSGPTDKTGMTSCSTKAPASGNYYVQAQVTDTKGFSSYASDSFWITGQRRAWFPADNNDRMDLIQQKKWAPTTGLASFEVHMPFATATVLVTVEREGILDAYVKTVTTQKPLIDVKVKSEYAPNVYVSALAVRGRVSGAGYDETATVDLGRPSYKLGLANLEVGKADHELKVAMKPSQDTPYMPRQQVSVDVTITDKSGKPVSGAEFALAVIEKGLLDLSKNTTWNILENMLGHRPLYVQTATAQMQVVGKRHFGLKARPTGGDGGLSAPTRTLFDPILSWQDRIVTDKNGHATVKFAMLDSLTAYKVVAIAHAGKDKFGKGEIEVSANKDLVLDNSMASLARTGDTYTADVSVHNTTKTAKTVIVGGTATFTMADGTTRVVNLTPATVTLAAQGSQLVSLGTVNAPEGAIHVKYHMEATDPSKSTRTVVDSRDNEQDISPSVLVRTWMAELAQVDSNLKTFSVELPATALPNQGGVQVSLIPSLASGLDSVSTNVLNYPFISLEYLVSRAVAVPDMAAWDAAMEKLPAYLDSEGLVMYYPNSSTGTGSDYLTGYILSMSAYSGFTIPDDVKGQMISGLTNYVEGKSRASRGAATPVDTYIHRVNAIAALNDVGAAKGTWMSSLPAINAQQIPSSTLVSLLSIYSSLKTVPQRVSLLQQTQDAIRLRLTGTTLLKFSDDPNRPWYALSSASVDQLRLILVLSSNEDLVKAWNNDIPQLVHAAVTMMSHGSWDLTIADAYGVLAVRAFSKQFEKQTVTGVTNVVFNKAAPTKFDWGTNPKGGVLNFGWPGVGVYDVDVTHAGTGKPWSIVAVNAAVPLTQKVEKGIFVTKSLSPAKAVYKVGDEVTVTLTIKASASLANVSLLDPIPAGAKIEGTGLDNDGNAGPQGMYADYEELGYDGYHASYSYIPTNTSTVSYKIRLNNAGTFKMPATRVEAIYAPDNFSETPNADITVQP